MFCLEKSILARRPCVVDTLVTSQGEKILHRKAGVRNMTDIASRRKPNRPLFANMPGSSVTHPPRSEALIARLNSVSVSRL
jgi:hypothetical protein